MHAAFKSWFSKFVPGLIGLFLSGLIFFSLVHLEKQFDSKPSFRELSSFEGKLVGHRTAPKTLDVFIEVKNQEGTYTFQLPKSCSRVWVQALPIGQQVAVRYHRAGIMSPIRAWNVESEIAILVSYKKLNAHHKCE